MQEFGIKVSIITNDGGTKYRQECEEAGVPIPKSIFSSEWDFQGIFNNAFSSPETQSEIWLYTSDSPQGVCIGLPRYTISGDSVSDESLLFAIICLGTQRNNACFFDNPRGKSFTRNVEIPIREFLGGSDLVSNGQGICSDCHAGENPYIVHPEKSAFMGLDPLHMPNDWYNPMVDKTWPQNPGPTNILEGVSSPGQCNSCLRQGAAGRFPEISSQLAGYCNTVLGKSVGPLPTRTMPPFGDDVSEYFAHISALQNSCGIPPENEKIEAVYYKDDKKYISPPKIIDPIYQCDHTNNCTRSYFRCYIRIIYQRDASGYYISSKKHP